MKHKFEKYCAEPENIENYEKAKADNFIGWCCHHRKGVDISKKELIASEMYFNRPANELIFMKQSEHRSLHMGGENNPMCNEKSRKKLSDVWEYEKHFTDKTRKKLSEAAKGKHWYNNGETEKFCYECPPGCKPGRLKRK